MPPVASAASPLVPTAGAATAKSGADAAVAGRGRTVDRLVTLALLAYGLVNVVITGLSYLDLPSVMNESMKILGIDGEFTNFAQGRAWGAVGAVVLVIGWTITAALSLRRLRRGHRTWWLPIVGAIVTGIAVSLCIAVPMMNDPAFIAYLTSFGQ